jgi:hypothetical protein
MPETASLTGKIPLSRDQKASWRYPLPGYMSINITRSKLRNEEWDQGSHGVS